MMPVKIKQNRSFDSNTRMDVNPIRQWPLSHLRLLNSKIKASLNSPLGV